MMPSSIISNLSVLNVLIVVPKQLIETGTGEIPIVSYVCISGETEVLT